MAAGVGPIRDARAVPDPGTGLPGVRHPVVRASTRRTVGRRLVAAAPLARPSGVWHGDRMPDYDRFARFYDAAMDDPSARGSRVLDSIRRHLPGASSILELGCGTGSILAQLTEFPALTGLDRSPEMLAVASQKVPSARLLRGDIQGFWLGERFDVVVCVFDTLNHLLTFEAWRSMFDAVYDHLVEDGLFIFDVNTVGELRRLGDEPPWVFDFDDHVYILDVSFEGEGLSEWDIRIFEHRGGARYDLHQERIGELAVPLRQVKAALAGRFVPLEETSESGETPTDGSVKAYFTYRRAP
jgi:SAM-dependent methyltransferase